MRIKNIKEIYPEPDYTLRSRFRVTMNRTRSACPGSWLNNTAFSLMEILLSAIIFIIAIGGIFATLNAVRTPVVNKEGSLSAAVFGKQVLESLRFQVSDLPSANFYTTCSGTCTDFSLALGTHQVPSANLPAGLSWPQVLVTKDSINYPNGNPPVLNYTVKCADGSGSCSANDTPRRVDLNINW